MFEGAVEKIRHFASILGTGCFDTPHFPPFLAHLSLKCGVKNVLFQRTNIFPSKRSKNVYY